MTDTPIAAAMTALARVDAAAAELDHLRAHLSQLALTGEPGTAYAAARSASIVSGITGDVADAVRGLAARQTLRSVS